MVFFCLKKLCNVIQGAEEKRGGGSKGLLIEGALNIKKLCSHGALN